MGTVTPFSYVTASLPDLGLKYPFVEDPRYKIERKKLLKPERQKDSANFLKIGPKNRHGIKKRIKKRITSIDNHRDKRYICSIYCKNIPLSIDIKER